MGIFQAFGIFAVSVSGHSSLPAIRSSMAHPQHFGRVLNFSFLVMTVIYGCVSGLGYYYFGDQTSQLVTTGTTVAGSPTSCFLTYCMRFGRQHTAGKCHVVGKQSSCFQVQNVIFSLVHTADLALRAPFAGHSLLVHGLTVDRVVNM